MPSDFRKYLSNFDNYIYKGFFLAFYWQREQLNTTRTSDNQEWNEKSNEQQGDQNESKDIETNDTSVEESKENVDEEPKEMTLDEYKQQQAAARILPKYNLRKPGEGEDNAQWKKTFRLEKKKLDDEEEDESEEVCYSCFCHVYWY